MCIYGFVSKLCFVQKFKTFETDSVFLSTLQLTALLWPKFRLRLHCYTLAFTFRGFTPKNLILLQKLIIQRRIGWRWSFWGNQTQFILNKGRTRFGYMHINTFWSIFFVISGSNTVAQFHACKKSGSWSIFGSLGPLAAVDCLFWNSHFQDVIALKKI